MYTHMYVHTYVYTYIEMHKKINEHGRLSIFANLPYHHAKLPIIIYIFILCTYMSICVYTYVCTYIENIKRLMNMSVCRSLRISRPPREAAGYNICIDVYIHI